MSNPEALRVSVVIPVYNAKPYLTEAVLSALAQTETAEVLLIDDGSSDGSLQVCQALAVENDRVRLLRHPDGKNLGAGASRNLGIVETRFDYVAFLDADDYFLPERFLVARELFANDSTVEGVYEAVGVCFEDEASRERWRRVRGNEQLTTMTRRVPPEVLFEEQSPIGPSGFCQTNGWIVKKLVFQKTGLFPVLRLHQDTVMQVKLAALGRMMPGRLDEAVAVRRVHSTNRSSVPRPAAQVYRDRVRMWVVLWHWGRRNLPPRRQQLVMRRFLEYATLPYREPRSGIETRTLLRVQMSLLALEYPDLLLEADFRVSYRRAVVPF